MDVKRVAGTSYLPTETTQPQTQIQPRVSRGVGDTSDSFETVQRQPANDLFAQLQRQQFSTGTFVNTPTASAAKTEISAQQLNQITAALKDAVANSSSPEEIAKALQSVVSLVESFPYVGPIIAAVLSAVASVMILIGEMMQKAKEDEGATKEKEAATKANPQLEINGLPKSEEEDPMEKLKKILLTLIQDLNSPRRD